MICLIALVVFGVLALFSAKYRPVAREAFDCVLRRITFRPCVANLDQRIKGQTSAWLLEHAPWAARFFYKNFELLSWALTLLMIWSIVAAGMGLYNWWAFGNCNGPGQTGFCVFNSIAEGGFDLGALLGFKPPLIKPTSDAGWLQGEANAELTIVEFGCYSCPYTKKAEPVVKELLEKYKGRVNVLFKAFPLPNHPYSTEMALASEAAALQSPEKWQEMHDTLFERQDYARIDGEKEIGRIAEGLGLDMERFWADFRSAETLERVETTRREGEAANIYGTPTFFIGDRTAVGPQTFEELRKLVDEALAKK